MLPPPEINSCKCLVCFNIEGGVVSGSCWIYEANPAVRFGFLRVTSVWSAFISLRGSWRWQSPDQLEACDSCRSYWARLCNLCRGERERATRGTWTLAFQLVQSERPKEWSFRGKRRTLCCFETRSNFLWTWNELKNLQRVADWLLKWEKGSNKTSQAHTCLSVRYPFLPLLLNIHSQPLQMPRARCHLERDVIHYLTFQSSLGSPPLLHLWLCLPVDQA